MIVDYIHRFIYQQYTIFINFNSFILVLFLQNTSSHSTLNRVKG